MNSVPMIARCMERQWWGLPEACREFLSTQSSFYAYNIPPPEILAILTERHVVLWGLDSQSVVPPHQRWLISVKWYD